MEISNNTFSAIIRKYENEAKIEEAEQTQELASETSQTVKDFAEQQYLQAQEASANSNGDFFVRSDGTATTISNINLVSVGDAEDVDSTEETNAVANGVTTVVQQASSYSDTDLDYIKELIYNSHHSFIANFRDADTFFDYVNAKKDSTITKETGISRAQLVSITQNDIWEDNHQDFFGSLNRSFYSLDKNGDGILKYDEIQEFMNTYLKKDGYNDFKAQVQAYSDEIQKEFESKSDQGKLEYAIKLTRDYLEAAGLTNQITALDRLLQGTDKNKDSTCKLGQISFVKYENSNQLGGYTYTHWPIKNYTNTNKNANETDKIYKEVPDDEKTAPVTNGILSNGDGTFTQTVGYFGSDEDYWYTDEDGKQKLYDAGMTLSDRYIAKGARWEELVDTLVHELTHATFSQYSTLTEDGYGIMKITEANLSALQRMGVFESGDFDTVKEHLSDINAQYTKYVRGDDGIWVGGSNLNIQKGSDGKMYISGHTEMSEEDSKFLDRLVYLMSCANGEYMAYQSDADFLDSIGGDIFNKRQATSGCDMAVDGENEKATIIKHLEQCGYNMDDKGNWSNEPLPDWKWWSYA